MMPSFGRRRQPAARQPRRDRREGLSLLEFIGCLIAIIGGAWLGAIYLGVDVRRAVYNAMAQSDVLDKVPPAWRPAQPDESFTREQMVATLREELGTLRSELADLRRGEQPPAESRPAPRPDVPAEPQASKANTLAYWNRLQDIVLGEAGLQQEADTALTEASAARVFALKGRISRFAAKAVAVIPDDEVDASALQLGKQLEEWYDEGGVLYERAAGIWQLPSAGQRTHLTKRWTPAELHHRNEAKLLSDKAATLREVLSRRFGVEFPPLTAPESAAGDQDTDSEADS